MWYTEPSRSHGSNRILDPQPMDLSLKEGHRPKSTKLQSSDSVNHRGLPGVRDVHHPQPARAASMSPSWNCAEATSCSSETLEKSVQVVGSGSKGKSFGILTYRFKNPKDGEMADWSKTHEHNVVKGS